MTLQTIVEQTMDLLSWLPRGVDTEDVISTVARQHRMMHQNHVFEETLRADSITWAASDGTSYDLSSDIPTWRGEPVIITSGSHTDPWTRVGQYQMLNRRQVNDSLFKGGIAYAVRVNTLMIVSAFTSDETVTITHYSNPVNLDDYSDTPSLPVEFQDILVYATTVELLERFDQEEDKAWARKQFGQLHQKYEKIMNRKWNKMVKKHGRLRGSDPEMAANIYIQGAVDQQEARGRYR